MKARDALLVSVLRTTLAALANAEAVDLSDAPSSAGLLGDMERRPLSEHDIGAIVARERDELRSGAEQLRALGRAEFDEMAARAAILDSYLSTSTNSTQ